MVCLAEGRHVMRQHELLPLTNVPVYLFKLLPMCSKTIEMVLLTVASRNVCVEAWTRGSLSRLHFLWGMERSLWAFCRAEVASFRIEFSIVRECLMVQTLSVRVKLCTPLSFNYVSFNYIFIYQ